MYYEKHYNLLIDRARSRNLDGYTEKHHIIPRCLNGSNNKNNIIRLTPEEHFVAHQLLVKIYPNRRNLIHAALMMCVDHNGMRINNKRYGWLRKRYAKSCKINSLGSNNSQFGTCWVSNYTTNECKKINKELLFSYLQDGWIKKRVITHWTSNTKICPQCGGTFTGRAKTCSRNCGGLLSHKSYPRSKFNNMEYEMIEYYTKGHSIYNTITEFGFCGTGTAHKRFKDILKEKKLL